MSAPNEPENKSPYNADLAKALERDHVEFSTLAKLVGLDPRTLAKYRTDREAEDCEKQRLLEDFVTGRARCKELRDGEWSLEGLGVDGVPRAVVDACRSDITAIALLLQGVELKLHHATLGMAPATLEGAKSSTLPLSSGLGAGKLGDMHAEIIQSIASRISRENRGQMVHFAQRVQPDLEARLNHYAAKWGVKPSDVLRVMVELMLPLG